jgi:1,2-diacylglycerol 3-alpha-glucosyltransferase
MVCEAYADSGGYQENHLAMAYRNLGHEVVIVTSHASPFGSPAGGAVDLLRPESDYIRDEIRIVRLPRSRGMLARRVLGFVGTKRVLVAERPGMVYVHDLHPDLALVTFLKRSNPTLRVVADFHGDFSNSARTPLSRLLLHRVYKRATLALTRGRIDQLYAITPASGAFLEIMYGLERCHYAPLPLGCDLKAVERLASSGVRQRIRAEIGAQPSHIVLISGGRLDRLKRTSELLRALRSIDRPNVWLILVGDVPKDMGDLSQELAHLSEGQRRVVRTGWIPPDKVAEYMCAADIGVFPASQSVLWQQCIGFGLPLIVGNHTGIPAGRQDVGYLNGFNNLLELEGIGDLARQLEWALTSLIDSPARLRAMSSGAKRMARERLDWEHLALRTLTEVGVTNG